MGRCGHRPLQPNAQAHTNLPQIFHDLVRPAAGPSSSPLYHSRPQTVWPDLFVFFRRFVRQPKEILLSSGQREKYAKNFRKFFNCGRRKSNGMRAASVVLSAARRVLSAAVAVEKLKKSNKTGAQIGRKQTVRRKNRRNSEMLSASGT